MYNCNLSWLNHLDIIDIVETASQLILQIYLGSDFYVEAKNDNSPLTIADKKANDYICSNLKLLYPNVPIISEENKNESYEQRKKYEFVWLIDPLDGTKEFIKKNGEFTVNIGLVWKGNPVAGFVNIPVKGLTYWAICGKGAWIRDISDYNKIIDLKEIRGYREEKKNRKPKVLASRSHMTKETEDFVNKLGDVELLNVGSSIKILWICENKADIYPRMNGSMEWDTCAAHAILKEVGGTMLSYNNGQMGDELVYNKENLLNPFFVCSRPLLFI